MATPTPNFGWQLPVPNSPIDANVWGTELNGNISSQDTLLLSAFTNNIGPTAPVSPILTAGATWINNTTSGAWLYYVYDGSQWVQTGTIDNITHTFIPVGSGGAPNVQIFTTSGTYVPSAGISYAVIDGVAGGGGGGGGTGSLASGGGGGSYFWSILNAGTIGGSQSIVIGAGGAGGLVNTGAVGGTGGNTLFGSLMTAFGGTGGFNNAYQSFGIGGATATGGLLNIHGGDGFGSSNGLVSGAGGSSPVFGQITNGVYAIGSPGKTGYGYGSGGTGCGGGNPGGPTIGGAGAGGIIRIVEYF